LWVIAAVLAVVALFWVVFPRIVARHIQRKLANIYGYTGRAVKVRVNFFEQSIDIEGAELVTRGASPQIPLFFAKRVTYSLHRRHPLNPYDLWSEVRITDPRLQVVLGAPENLVLETRWRRLTRALEPYGIERIDIRNGELQLWKDEERRDGVRIDRIFAQVRDSPAAAASGLGRRLTANGKLMSDADVEVTLEFDAHADKPRFELSAALDDLDLTRLNAFLRAQQAIEFQRGWLSIDARLHARDGSVEGGFRPRFRQMELSATGNGRSDPRAGMALTKNAKGEMAAQIPIQGRLHEAASLWRTVLGFLKSSFVRTLLPHLEDWKALIDGG
jgi:hypothetical protein